MARGWIFPLANLILSTFGKLRSLESCTRGTWNPCGEYRQYLHLQAPGRQHIFNTTVGTILDRSNHPSHLVWFINPKTSCEDH